MSRSSVESGTPGAVFPDNPHGPTSPGVIGGILGRIKNPDSRTLLSSNVFSHLRAVESCVFENETCMGAIAAAMSEIEHLQNEQADDPPVNLEISNKQANTFIQSKLVSHSSAFTH